jgi:hypothetical protein
MHRFWIIIFFFFFTSTSIAQLSKPQFAIPLTFAVPINEFQQVSSAGSPFAGIGAELNFPIKYSPIRFGFSFRYHHLASKSRDVVITDSFGSYDVSTRVRGAMMPFHIFGRFDLMNIYDYPVLPYAGGFIGWRFFNVVTVEWIDYRDGNEPERIRDKTGSAAISYGFQLGLHIRLNPKMLLDLRWERAYGGEARYLDVQSIEIDSEGYATYELRETRTDADLITIGLVWEFH